MPLHLETVPSPRFSFFLLYLTRVDGGELERGLGQRKSNFWFILQRMTKDTLIAAERPTCSFSHVTDTLGSLSRVIRTIRVVVGRSADVKVFPVTFLARIEGWKSHGTAVEVDMASIGES